MATSAMLIIIIIWNTLVSIWNSYASGILWQHGKTKWERTISIFALIAGFIGIFYTFVLIFVALGYLSEAFIIYSNVFIGWAFIPLGLVFIADGIRTYKETKSGWVLFFTILNSFITIWNIFAWIQSICMFYEIGGIKTMLKENRNSWLFIIIAILGAIFLAYGFFTLGKKKAESLKQQGIRKKNKI
ncbi:MAG: hypothetical protein ACOCUU_03345 [Nanoarchaeota archaeon]